MEQKLRILILEDVATDAELIERELRKGGIAFSSKLVATKDAFLKELKEFIPDLVLSDYSLPQFDGLSALAITKEQCPDVPFILISGTIGEEFAIEALKSGVTDYVLKHRLSRLVPAVRRALQEAEDLLERKRAQEALEESENKYRTLVDNTLAGVYKTNLKGDILYVNEALSKMLDFESPEEMMTESVIKRYKNPKYREILLETLNKKQNAMDFETELLTKMGKTKNVLISAILEGDTISGMIMDITERKRAEEALRESEGRLRAVTESAKDAIIMIDHKGDISYWNPAAERIFGYGKDEALGRNVHKLLAPEKYYEAYLKAFPEFTRTGMGNAIGKTLELTGLLKTGEEIPIEISLSAILVEGHWHAVAIIRDITERKRAQEALEESEKKYRTLFEESKDAIFISTPNGRFLDINPAGVELFGYSSMEELLNTDVDKEIYLHLGYRKRFMELVDKEGFVRDFEFMMRRKNGEIINVLVTASCIRDDKGNLIACRGIMHDITEKKKLEQQLLHAQKMEAVGQLTGGIAHDFNNILTAIIGYSSLLQMKMSKDDPLRHNADQILASSERAANLVQSLLAFSRKQIMNLQPVKINEIVKRVEKLLLRIIGEDIELKTVLTEGDLTVMADSGQIEQVLMNLATNARDAMPKGGSLTIETETVELDEKYIKTHGYGEPGMYAFISFTDTGEGMDERTRERIFEPFFTTKEVGKGTGLGLSMVYGIIKQHNGYINAYSELAKGTTFKIYLPLTKKEVKEIKPTEPAPLIGGIETVLLAEDDADVRKFTRKVLEEFGYAVIEAVDGEDAIDKFMENKDKVQLLMLDVIMPKKNGRGVYEEIKKTRPDIKVLFMSGYTANVIHKQGILEEGLNFVLKPISPTNLLRKIREVLDKD